AELAGHRPRHPLHQHLGAADHHPARLPGDRRRFRVRMAADSPPPPRGAPRRARLMKRARRRLSYANVVSTLALIVALAGGTVYAASTIGPKQIKKGAVRSRQIKDRQVKRQDIAGGSINRGKGSNDALTGKGTGG